MIDCLHIPHFPAWAYRHSGQRPEPVVVAASGRVVAASAACRRAGVRAAMPVGKVPALLAVARIVPRDRALEQTAWEHVLSEVNALTPFLESGPAGTLFFSGAEREAVKRLTSELPAQTGSGRHRPTALLAAVRAASGTSVEVPPGREAAFLQRFHLARLAEAGFSGEFIEALGLFGYSTLHAAGRLSRKHLNAQFGAEGARLFEMLHPSDEPPVPLFRPAPVLAEAYDFEQPALEPGEILPVLRALAQQAASRLRPYHCQRVRVLLHLHRETAPRYASRLLPEATDDPRRLLQTAMTLLGNLLAPDLEIDRVALELGSLRVLSTRQQSLFQERPDIYTAVRAVHRKYQSAVVRAVPAPHALFHEEQTRFEVFPDTAPPVRGRRKARAH